MARINTYPMASASQRGGIISAGTKIHVRSVCVVCVNYFGCPTFEMVQTQHLGAFGMIWHFLKSKPVSQGKPGGKVLSQILSGTENTAEKGFLLSVPLPVPRMVKKVKELHL